MAYDEEDDRTSRVVVDTPTERREYVHSRSVRTPDNEGGVSTGMIGVLVVVAIALITMIVLFWMSNQQATETANITTQPQQPTIVQQPAPAQQPPVIIQQPAPVTTQPAPIIVTQPAGGATSATESVNMDSTIQAAIDKTLSDDPVISALGITASVIDSKVTLLGTAKSDAQKAQIERMVKQVKGVNQVDNKIIVVVG